MDLSQSKKALESHVDELGQPFVSFFTGLWDLEESIVPVDWTPEDASKLTDAMAKGETAFSIDAPKISQEYLFESLESALAFIGMYVDDFAPVGKKFAELKKEYDAGEREISEGVLDIVFTQPEVFIDELAEMLEIDKESELYHYLRLAVATVLEPTAVEAASKIELPKELGFKTGVCPVCGAQATMGMLKNVGEMHGSPRELSCGFCGTHWPFPRIKCTWCGSTNPEDLDFSFDEGNMNKRVYTCKKCGGTQKIVLESTDEVANDARANELLMLPLEQAVLESLEDAE